MRVLQFVFVGATLLMSTVALAGGGGGGGGGSNPGIPGGLAVNAPLVVVFAIAACSVALRAWRGPRE